MNDPGCDLARLSDAIEAIAEQAERYERYAADLHAARAELAGLRRGLPVELDDIESELTYLRLRALAPATVVQVGCGGGWSTAWLLRALRDNGAGRLITIGPTGPAAAVLPRSLTAGRWHPAPGRPRTGFDAARADYLFVERPGSAAFANWCLDAVVGSLAAATPVSVGGVFGHRPGMPFGGAARVRRWLDRSGAAGFTAAPAREPVVRRQLARIRRALGFTDQLGSGRREATVFFRCAGAA